MTALAPDIQQIEDEAHCPLGSNCREGWERRSRRARPVFPISVQAKNQARSEVSPAPSKLALNLTSRGAGEASARRPASASKRPANTSSPSLTCHLQGWPVQCRRMLDAVHPRAMSRAPKARSDVSWLLWITFIDFLPIAVMVIVSCGPMRVKWMSPVPAIAMAVEVRRRPAGACRPP